MTSIAVITEPCIATCDTACVDVCPVDCIHGPVPVGTIREVPNEERPNRFPNIQMYVNPRECIECGACMPACPVDAIYAECDLPEHYRHYVELNARFFESA